MKCNLNNNRKDYLHHMNRKPVYNLYRFQANLILQGMEDDQH